MNAHRPIVFKKIIEPDLKKIPGSQIRELPGISQRQRLETNDQALEHHRRVQELVEQLKLNRDSIPINVLRVDDDGRYFVLGDTLHWEAIKILRIDPMALIYRCSKRDLPDIQRALEGVE